MWTRRPVARDFEFVRRDRSSPGRVFDFAAATIRSKRSITVASFSLALLGASQAVGATVQHWTDTDWVLQTLAAPSYKQAQNARAGAFRLVRGLNRITLPSRLDDGLTPGVADDIRSAYGDLAAQDSLISVRSRWI